MPKPKPKSATGGSEAHTTKRRGAALPNPGKKKVASRIQAKRAGTKARETEDNVESASWADVRKLVEGIRWLVNGWVPNGMLTGVIAEPKVGKSAFVLGAIAQPVLTGCNWFNGQPGPDSGYVVWCDTEGSAAINIERAGKWKLPDEKVKVPFPDDPLRAIDLENSEHMARLHAVVRHYEAKLLVVDSFRGAHGGNENDSKIARVLQTLTTIAEQTKTAVVVIHHTKKLSADEEMTANSGRGSNAFLAMVRCQIAIDRPDPEGEWRRVRILGENLGVAPPPVGFRFVDGGLEFGAAPKKPRKATEKDSAAEWLRSRMKPGKAYTTGDIIAEAKQLGHSERTVRKAATEILGIRPKPIHAAGKILVWKWKLPAD